MTLTWHHTAWEIQDNPPDFAILPLACYEPHGPHLPVGTDIIIMNEVASQVAQSFSQPVLLLPTWPIGTSLHHSGQPGALSLSYDTLWAVVRDVVTSLHAHGIHRVAVLNNHGSAMTTTSRPIGNFIVKTAVRQLNYETPGLTAIWVQPFAAARQALMDLFPSAHQEMHAGVVETSILMHLAPDSVGLIPNGMVPTVSPAFLDFAPLTQFSPGGVWGDPAGSSAEKGKLALDSIVVATSFEINQTFAQLQEIKK
jgi:creatinine amidohydrolase